MTPRIFFPGRLLRAIHHAESFCIFLSRLDVRRFDMARRAWLLGRRQEIACFAEGVGRDFRLKRIDESAATACIEAYLGALHAGVALHFGHDRPPCCAAPSAVASVAPRPIDSTPTTLFVKPPAGGSPARPPRPDPQRRRPTADDSATWIDVEPDHLLAGLTTRSG